MSLLVYPYYVSSLAPKQGEEFEWSRKGRPRDRWILNVAGPICLWPRPLVAGGYLNYSSSIRIQDTLSRLLSLPVRMHRDKEDIWLQVEITPEIRESLIKREYQRVTGVLT